MRMASIPLFRCSLAVTACLWLAGCTTPSAPGPANRQASSSTWTLTIAHMDDSHSHVDGLVRTLSLAGPDGTRHAVQVQAGGFPRIKTLMEAIRRRNPDVLALHAGDSLTGTLYFNRAGRLGEPDAAMMRAVCFDAMALGNHEFDKGDSALASYLGQLREGSCKTAVLSANTHPGPRSALAAHDGQPAAILPSTIVERRGHRIGIIGITTASKTRQSSSPDAGTTFEEETGAAQREIDRLRAAGVQVIVLLTHIGYEADQALITRLGGVDVVVGGDSHTLLGPEGMSRYRAGSPAGPYPTVLKNRDGKTTCLVHAHEYTQVLGELQVQLDAQGDVVACHGTPHVPIDTALVLADGRTRPDVALREAMQRDMAASGFLTPVPEDADTAAALRPYQDKVAAFRNRELAYAPTELCSRRVPGGLGSINYSQSSAECNAIGHVKVHGGDIQQLVAQAYLDIADSDYGGADIALLNGGGVRVPLAGRVTAARVLEVLPFGNTLWRLHLTGTEVQSMIEDGLEAVFGPNASTGSYPYAAGLRFQVQAGAARGRRASHFEVFDRQRRQWAPLAAGRTYRVMTLAFAARGGDGYATLARVPASRRQDIGIPDAEAFMGWIERQPRGREGLPVLQPLPQASYSTQAFTGP